MRESRDRRKFQKKPPNSRCISTLKLKSQLAPTSLASFLKSVFPLRAFCGKKISIFGFFMIRLCIGMLIVQICYKELLNINYFVIQTVFLCSLHDWIGFIIASDGRFFACNYPFSSLCWNPDDLNFQKRLSISTNLDFKFIFLQNYALDNFHKVSISRVVLAVAYAIKTHRFFR